MWKYTNLTRHCEDRSHVAFVEYVKISLKLVLVIGIHRIIIKLILEIGLRLHNANIYLDRYHKIYFKNNNKDLFVTFMDYE